MLTPLSFPDFRQSRAFDDVVDALLTHPRVCHVRHQLSRAELTVVVEERATSAWYALEFAPVLDERWVLARVVPWGADTDQTHSRTRVRPNDRLRAAG